VIGALVTSHKIDLLDASRDLFDGFDRHAALCGEVSCIAKRNGRLLGTATDPVAGSRSLYEILGAGYFGRTDGKVLCLGAGGAGTALALALIDHPDPADRPRRFTAVDINRSRLERLRVLLEHSESDIEFGFVHNTTPTQIDDLLSTLPPYSVIINATGLGKDRPGSPLTDAAIFPIGAIAWELNYRGDLDFLRQAQRQRDERRLCVEDGWRYFLHGWLGVIAVVLDITISDEAFQRCAAVVADVR
jgi:shikimate dehydrogenase